jgi:hypothetical protein
MKPKVNDIPIDDEFIEQVGIVGRYLWQYFETGAPDTPARVFRVVKYALEQNGYTITKTNTNQGGQNAKDTHNRNR